MTTLYSLGALTIAGYRVRTGDDGSTDTAVSGALVESESLMEEELRRLLPSASRSETMILDDLGRVYPKAWPITACATNVIDGRAILGAVPDINQFVALIGTWVTPRATLTYTGGFTAATLPVTLAHALYDLAQGVIADRSPMLVGATSVTVGDVSVGGLPAAADGIDAYVPGLSRRVRKYRNRWFR